MTLRTKALLSVGAFVLAACAGGSSSTSGIGTLGADFVAVLSAEETAEPVDAQEVDIASISFTADPFNP
ncbi:hypothetical protein [Pseudaestuariivita sp.]|uniref:hypothetical protein n=1 Tax=Pseudaestuariivita sp. TaxID=2211669 RepID=UPI004059C39C